jgi:alcohol dehydrogenase
MRQLMLVAKNRLEWRDAPEAKLQGGDDAIVRPFVVARCDLDLAMIRGSLASAFRLGKLLRQTDPDVGRVLGDSPYKAPFPFGHECVAEVIACGENVRSFRRGDKVVVPFQISCGGCLQCGMSHTAQCGSVPTFSMYGGVGGKDGGWGGALSDSLRVPYADSMLVRVPEGVDPVAIASASDNLPDGWRCVAPQLNAMPGARVLVVGGGAKSIGLYAAAFAVALGSERVDYFDRDKGRLAVAANVGANPVEGSFMTAREHADGYPIVVDASAHPKGLRFALRSASVGGVCTSVGVFPRRETGLPMMRMYSHSLTLKNGVASARPSIPAILELVKSGRLKPQLITTTTADWEEAPQAFKENATKVVVTRNGLTA